MQDLCNFLNESHTQYHAACVVANRLDAAGYTRLSESEKWDLAEGGAYYVTRNGSAVMAFRLPRYDFTGFMIGAVHSDSPTFRVKENAEMTDAEGYVRLNVEGYGSMLCAPWMDRPLTVAGRVMVSCGNTIETRLVYVDKDLLIIPHVAIHMNRGANTNSTYDLKTDMVPLFALGGEKGGFKAAVADAAGCDPEDILGTDLYLRLRQPALIWGENSEFISSAKLDDLQCAYGCLQGFLQAEAGNSVPLFALLDNEEVGSLTKQGADGTFMQDVIDRICEATGKDKRVAQANSFMVSADNAHAVHPNHPEYADATHRPHMNEGIVVKHGVRYSTDGASQAIFVALCRKAGVPVQFFFNRSDLTGGSTLGNIANAHVSLNTVDIGLPQLSMHSSYETAGVKDAEYLAQAMKLFYASTLEEVQGTFTLM